MPRLESLVLMVHSSKSNLISKERQISLERSDLPLLFEYRFNLPGSSTTLQTKRSARFQYLDSWTSLAAS